MVTESAGGQETEKEDSICNKNIPSSLQTAQLPFKAVSCVHTHRCVLVNAEKEYWTCVGRRPGHRHTTCAHTQLCIHELGLASPTHSWLKPRYFEEASSLANSPIVCTQASRVLEIRQIKLTTCSCSHTYLLTLASCSLLAGICLFAACICQARLPISAHR